MKKLIILFIIVFLILAAVPVISVQEFPSAAADSMTVSFVPQDHENSFLILNTADGNVSAIDDKEFLYGALSYEMPPYFETEALKAQAVATYTFFTRKRLIQRQSPDPEMKGADFSADLSIGQFYLSDEMRREKWGNEYDDTMKKIRSICDSVYGQILTDSSGQPIDAAYHAISGGTTENAEDVFGKAEPYLRAVPSPGDIYAPDYLTDPRFTADEFRSRIRKISDDITFSGNPESYIKKIDRTVSGTVRKINICAETFTGSDIRKAFDLRSANFEISYNDGMFIFMVRGYGHGVGMSQYGAQSMAQSGAGYKEILSHYYPQSVIGNSK